MPQPDPPLPVQLRIYALVPDLFFMSKIGSTAAQLGILVEELRMTRAITACRNAPPDLLMLDLHAEGDPLTELRPDKCDDHHPPQSYTIQHVQDGLAGRVGIETNPDESFQRDKTEKGRR